MHRQYYGQVMACDWDADLEDLRWHYGDAYLIHYFPGPGRWVAQRSDSHATMSADAPDRLLDLIRADYAAHPCRFLPEG
jgi:hypothetical protein